MDNNNARIVSNSVIEGENECITDSGAMDQDSKMVIEIEKMLDKLEPPPSSECCIYRVPTYIRKLKEEAYTPSVVSIGPFHHNNKNLESMEQVKKRYMKKLVQRSGLSSLKKCFNFVKEREKRIRDCYSEHIEMDIDEFVGMILVDSCFIIQFLISYHNNWKYESLEPMIDHNFINISRDLILLENQVPLFVLEGLCTQITFVSSEAFTLPHLAFHFLDQTLDFEKPNKDISKQNFLPVKHLAHLVLTLYFPPSQEKLPPQKKRFKGLPSSMNLTEAGVTFKKKSPSKGLFDITFTNGVLEIPNFSLYDDTEIQIRNLMALEFFLCPGNGFITHFFLFMDSLINTAGDVDLLVEKKIIVNCLGDNKAAAHVFNHLCMEMLIDDKNFYFSQVCSDLRKFYRTPWHFWKAKLKHDYFKTPWKTASTVAAIMLLVLTLIQTVCSILSVVNRKPYGNKGF